MINVMEQLSLFDNSDISISTNDNYRPIITPNNHNIVLESNVIKDKYTQYIQDKFDLKVSDVSIVEIPCNLKLQTIKDWNIGVICGSSGSGKSTILKKIANEMDCEISEPHFDDDCCLISNFNNMSPQDATLLLSSIGLASVPTWIRPYSVLSNGEKFRAQIAKSISETSSDSIIFIDEYTSVVDRNVAKAMSNALQKYIRKNNKKIVLATCHYDVFDWLKPDWIYDLNKGGALIRGDYLQRPKIELQVYRTTYDTWDWFKKYHYMTSELNKAAMCFVFTWENHVVAFYSVLPQPSGQYKNAYRGHRLVVLPDYQWFGIGGKISEFIGGVLKSIGKTMYTKTVNPAIGIYRTNNKTKWKPSAANLKADTQEHIDKNSSMGGLTRPSYCFKYVGEPIYGFENLVLPIDELKKRLENENQLSLFNEQ